MHVSTACNTLTVSANTLFNWWVNVSGHVITTDLATPILELKPLECCRPWIFWANFDVHSGLLTDTKTWWWSGDYTTLFGPHLVPECHFWAPWSRTNSQKWRGAVPLNPPRCVSPQAQWKTGGFFVFFNLTQFHHILTLFAQVMVSKASVTNHDA